MAIDTRDKRAACIGVNGPYRFVLPDPDVPGETQADRQQIAYSYPGILAGVETPPTPPPATTTLPQAGGGDRPSSRSYDPLPFTTSAPMFRHRKLAKAVPPEEVAEPETAPAEDVPVPAISSPLDYGVTDDDFLVRSPSAPPAPSKPRIRRGRCTFRIQLPRLETSGVVRCLSSARIRLPNAKESSVRIVIPQLKLRASGYVRWKDDAIALAMGRPELEEALSEWVVG